MFEMARWGRKQPTGVGGLTWSKILSLLLIRSPVSHPRTRLTSDDRRRRHETRLLDTAGVRRTDTIPKVLGAVASLRRERATGGSSRPTERTSSARDEGRGRGQSEGAPRRFFVCARCGQGRRGGRTTNLDDEHIAGSDLGKLRPQPVHFRSAHNARQCAHCACAGCGGEHAPKGVVVGHLGSARQRGKGGEACTATECAARPRRGVRGHSPLLPSPAAPRSASVQPPPGSQRGPTEGARTLGQGLVERVAVAAVIGLLRGLERAPARGRPRIAAASSVGHGAGAVLASGGNDDDAVAERTRGRGAR